MSTGTELATVHAGTDIAAYPAAQVMTPDQARALDEQVRRCTEAVLREGTDYGVIPGTSGEKTLWRPGAQKLLQWFGLSVSCERVEIERDEQGRKHGITYRATVARRMPDGSLDIKATCEGTADYDESKFYQDVEAVRARLRDQEHKWAKKDHRPPNADRWNCAREYRADWNALMKRAQKRAIVGAVVDATAAGGIFSEREEDDHAAALPQDDGPTWYEQALEQAVSFTDVDEGRALYVEAAEAHRAGRCTRRQQDYVQNIVRKRGEQLKTVQVVEVEDIARQAAAGEPEPDPTQPAEAADASTATDSSTASAAEDPSDDRHGKLISIVQGNMKRLGFAVDDNDREERMNILAKLAKASRDGSDWYQSTSDFDEDELDAAAGQLVKCRSRKALSALLADGEKPGGDGDA